MFDFEKPENGSEDRYYDRITTWKTQTQHLPKVKHWGWWFVHNVIAHPLIGLLPFHFAFEFHDWTSRKLNGNENL